MEGGSEEETREVSAGVGGNLTETVFVYLPHTFFSGTIGTPVVQNKVLM